MAISAPSPDPRARPHWLNNRRLRAYPWLFLVAFAAIAGYWMVQSEAGLDVEGKPLGYDFVSFWSASTLALEGEPAASYQPERILETGRRAIPDLETRYIWSYPPTFHLLVLPLGLLPFLAGYFVWFLVWLIPFLLVIRRLAPAPETLMLALAFPGTLLNLAQGQNGLMIAALFGGAMLWLRPRPVLAGILIGLMSCKPHFGLLIPIALICGRHWTAFWAAAATTVTFAAVSLLAFGRRIGWRFSPIWSSPPRCSRTAACPGPRCPAFSPPCACSASGSTWPIWRRSCWPSPRPRSSPWSGGGRCPCPWPPRC